MVQRSPSHFQTGTFYWSHVRSCLFSFLTRVLDADVKADEQHEKLCVIDETIAFMGGLDLCFGRWDTPQHVLTDEDYTEPNGPNGPVFHGKDYANERVAEYAALNKPFEDSIDRHKIPRMPW
jgi:phospholipase D1/2